MGGLTDYDLPVEQPGQFRYPHPMRDRGLVSLKQ